MSRGQAERLFPLLEEMLTDTGKSWTDLNGIGCGIGPGNFTGIRLSVSAARGLALSLKIPAIGVSSFEALAEGLEHPVIASVDARRDQAYLCSLNSGHTDQMEIADLNNMPARFKVEDAVCVGHRSSHIAGELGLNVVDPPHPIAVAIAHVAIRKLDFSNPRPAPLYVKSADAAPSKDAPPMILQ